MKTRLSAVLLAAFITTVASAQKFATSIDVAPLATFESNQTTQSKTSFGISAAITEYYKIAEKLDLGMGIGFSGAKYTLLMHIISPNTDYESNIKLTSLNIPLILRYRTKNNWFVQASYGLSVVIKSKSEVHYSMSFTDPNNVTTTEVFGITDKSDNFKDNMHSIAELSIGKSVTIKKIKTNIQLFYQTTIGTYNFTHLAYRQALFVPFYFDYKIHPQQAGLKIGIEL